MARHNFYTQTKGKTSGIETIDIDCLVLDTFDKWCNKGHANNSMIISKYITYLLRPKGNISDIDLIEHWHTKGHTDSFIHDHCNMYDF